MSSSLLTSSKLAEKKKVTSERNKFKFQQASSAIAGTADGLKRQLAKLNTGAAAVRCNDAHCQLLLWLSIMAGHVADMHTGWHCRAEGGHQGEG